jgi:cell wall-associated NlpC family hydrolase
MSFVRVFSISLCFVICISVFSGSALSQDRERVVANKETRGTETQKTANKTVQKPTLTNQILVQSAPKLVKKTGSSQPTGAVSVQAPKNAFGVSTMMKSQMMSSINSKLGIPYLYGSTGPNRYDCSGFVWTIFQESGIDFLRGSARTYWNEFEAVTGDDRFKFGTLVFFNGLGHMGIVADENGFYHASSSKGITYSKFAGYWQNRIVGYRRIPIDQYSNLKTDSK